MSLATLAFYNPLTASLFRRLHQAKARILTYHRFPSADMANFELQCAHLAKHYHPISLDELAHALRENRPLPPRAVAITIDDGYRDVFVNGVPMLKRYGLPATLYAVSGFLDRQCWMWWDCVAYAFVNSPKKELELTIPGRDSLPVVLGSPENRRETADRVATYLVRRDNSQATQWCQSLADQLGVTLPSEPPPDFEAMTWDEARQLPSMGVSVGAHTVNHWVIGTLPDAEQRRREITGGRQRLEQMLDRPVMHFSFPNGGIGDFSQSDLAMVREAGYASSSTTFYGMVGSYTDPYQLPRMNAGAEMDFDLFRAKVAGMFQHSTANYPVRAPLT